MALVVNSLVTVHPHAACPSQSLERPAPNERQSITQHLQLVCHILQQRAVQLRFDEHSDGDQVAPSPINAAKSHTLHVSRDVDGQLRATLPALQLSASQYAARCNALQVLQKYIEQGQYPAAHSTDVQACGIDVTTKRLPVFIDRISGVHCAVGHLMAATGHGQLAADIDQMAHTSYIRQLTELQAQLSNMSAQALTTTQQQQLLLLHDFAQWQHSVGLTVDELAYIQPSYMWRDENGKVHVDDSHMIKPISFGQPPPDPAAALQPPIALGVGLLVLLQVLFNYVPAQHSALVRQYELHRKLQHIVSMLLITHLYTTVVSPQAVPYILLVTTGCMLALHYARLYSPAVKQYVEFALGNLARPYELTSMPGAYYCVLGLLINHVSWGSSISTLALLYVAVGDPAASLAGQIFAQRQQNALPGTAQNGTGSASAAAMSTPKTRAGSNAMFNVCLLASLFVFYFIFPTQQESQHYRGYFHQGSKQDTAITSSTIVAYTLVGSVTATVIEHFTRRPLDDNLTVQVGTGCVLGVLAYTGVLPLI